MTTRKVRIVQALAGHNYTYQSGEEVELPEEQALRWIEKGLAEQVDAKSPEQEQKADEQEQKADIPAQVEQATSTEHPETASLTTRRKKPGRPRKKTE